MATASPDSSQWLSVTEETIFLHDGLVRVTDLVDLPHDVKVDSNHSDEHDIVSFDSKNPQELSEKLMSVCGNQNNAYARLLEYRLNALRGLWNTQLQVSVEGNNESDVSSSSEAVALLKKQGLWREPEQAGFSTRVSLLLVLPLLQSQSKFDPSICGVTAELLLNCLQECSPLSLMKEPSDCLNGIEKLLTSWLGEEGSQTIADPNQRKTAASALVALACARGQLETFMHTVHLLQRLDNPPPLPVKEIISKLNKIEGGQGPPSALLGNKHVHCWGFEDQLSVADKDPVTPVSGNAPPNLGAQVTQAQSSSTTSSEPEVRRSISGDGKFLYMNSITGKGIVIMGSGLHGTLRGYVYAKNDELETGWIAWADGVLIHRPYTYDKDVESLNICQTLDPITLQPASVMVSPEDYIEPCVIPITTIGLCSDGQYFYWIWSPGLITEKTPKAHNVYVETFTVDLNEKVLKPIRKRIVIQKKDDVGIKGLNESLMAKLRPYRGSTSAVSLVALTGTPDVPAPPKKEEAVTSCGLVFKTLVKSPIFCDGSNLVMMVAVSGGPSSASGRFSFGTTSGLSGMRVLASQYVFSLEDGQFVARTDFADAPSSALARGAPLSSLAIAYDYFNNALWSASRDWIDQYQSPAHQATHHIQRRLCLNDDIQMCQNNSSLEISSVIQHMLQHVLFTSVHQLNELACNPSQQEGQPPTFNIRYVTQICDILEHALNANEPGTIICMLVSLQLFFKTAKFIEIGEQEDSLLQRTRDLLWKVLEKCSKSLPETEMSVIQTEFCMVISSGLNILYPQQINRFALLHSLLSCADDKAVGLHELRDLLLVEFSDQLRSSVMEPQLVLPLRLNDELISYILKLAVKESNNLLRQSQTTDRKKLEEILVSVPIASPCLRYLMALQTHLLRSAMLHHSVLNGKGTDGTDTQTPTPVGVNNEETLQQLQSAILNLAIRVFHGVFEVLETVLETCNFIINSGVEDLEYWLQSLERITKATVLGQLLPVLITGMTHHNLQNLTAADMLMPQLVQLVVLTSKAALLLKSQVQAIQQDMLFDINDDMDIAELIGQSISMDSLELEHEEEEQGFLAGLKIPAPWTSGKTVESVHPVRDNYRYKTTVHIPGARCLYLRFDPRCSSQYDYDKLVLYAGGNTSSRKVAEYGGNTFGYGSRSVLGAGWPKDLVKVDGDTVTFSFEMRSGREHNTPDKAMWGFLVTVRARETPDDQAAGLPFLADLALALSVLSCTMLHLLYQGPDRSKDEDVCEHLLRSKLLQRCVWQSEKSESPIKAPSPITCSKSDTCIPSSPKSLPRVRLPMEIVKKLRDLSEKQPPMIRPSISEVIMPDMLEESILSASLKHLSLVDTVQHLSTHEVQRSPEYLLLKDVIGDVYRRLYAIIRQLQTIGELEQKWRNEVNDIKSNSLKSSEAFFIDYHLQENKVKDLAILCYLKDLEFDPANQEQAVTDLSEKLEAEVSSSEETCEPLQKTKQVVSGVLERLHLLLQVTIAPEGECAQGFITRSTSTVQAPPKDIPSVMTRSDTDMFKPPTYRSHSAPTDSADDSVLDIARLAISRFVLCCSKRQRRGPATVLQDLVMEQDGGADLSKPPHVLLMDQLFSFIGSSPETAVSSESFLAAARVRYRRGNTRRQALVHMKELLTAASRVGGATHLVAAVTSVLQHGPRIDELTCGGICHQVREAFAETMTSVVQLAARYPMACCNSIGLMCIIPYTRAEEKCLVRSGLVHLLDKLCSLTNYRGSTTEAAASGGESQSQRTRVSAMAWAGFQVLSNRCVTWEQEDGGLSEQLEHSGLARQVSFLLTNHLARATECSGNQAAGNEALAEVLSLLNNLARSKMGKAILSQPGCVSKLLSLLLDQRPSPKLVLIILQLCRVALPLMTSDDCEKVELPSWGGTSNSASHTDIHDTGEQPTKIASLLLAKLGDFLIPGGQTAISSRRPSDDQSPPSASTSGEANKSSIHDGRITIYVHKRDDQSSHEVIQPLVTCEYRPFRLSGGANMEKVVRLDGELIKNGKAEVTTEEAVAALRKAAKWASLGLVVSSGPPIDVTGAGANTGAQSPQPQDKKKAATEVVCKEKNSELARTDPVRPFISGHVANSMAAEVIGLLHSLLAAPETSTAQTWTTAVEKVLSDVLSYLPLLIGSIDELGSRQCNKEQLMCSAKLANAGLAALGGFEETIKPGCKVQIIGDGIENSPATVLSVSEQTGLATVELDPVDSEESATPPRFSDTMQVPLCRLRPPRNEALPLYQLSMTEAMVSAVQSLLLPHSGPGSPMGQQLPVYDNDGNSLANQICRILAEIKSRAAKVLSCHLHDPSFARAFIQHSSASIDILKLLAQEVNPGERLSIVEDQCQRRRLLYRDCAKPPPPPIKMLTRPAKEICWDINRAFPPVRSTIFSHNGMGITFLGDPSVPSGLPRGLLVYASQPLPSQAPSFYWEIEIMACGDQADDSGPFISFGFMPAAEKKDGGWTQPVGSCLFHNNGRAVHYNGSSLLLWKSVRLDVMLKTGDIAGVGWQRQGDTPPVLGQTVKGVVYFTHNGRKLPVSIDDVAGGMWPVVHLQKKNARIRSNFGHRKFAYAAGTQHMTAAEECHDITQEIRETFRVLPFNLDSGSDNEGATSVNPSGSEAPSHLRSPPGPPCREVGIPQPLKEYNCEAYQTYKLLPCYENFPRTGPETQTPQSCQDTESDQDEVGEQDEPAEDHYALLVKAWEQKVFPTIRRRFRNEAERKDGLEQIRGALQLGMVDIARQTVEFLYEENGGMPRDLHLPTIEDIREELAKFSAERLRKGTVVVIKPNSATTLPKYCVRSMMKTFGLMGTVLDVDQTNELVQVESYLRSEGVLVRFWYPIEQLERPPQGYRKASIVGNTMLDTSNIHLHRSLLDCEYTLARMHCRSAFLELINQCNSPAMELASCATSLGSAMAASAALLQELDVENLQLLSTEQLAAPQQPHGCVEVRSLATAPAPTRCLLSSSVDPTSLLYETSDALKEELRVAIARAANQGEDYLIELSNQICMCLQTAPELFAYEEIPVSETKVCTDVHFPGASFLVVSCKSDPKAMKKDTSLYKSPWARIFTYRGQRIKKTGSCTKQEVLCYPRDCSSSSNRSDQYAPAIIPTDLVHVRIGVSPPPGAIVTIHALPPQFPLALTYIQVLVSESRNFEYRKEEGVDLGACAGASASSGASTNQSSSQDSSSYPGGATPTSPWRTFDSIVVPPPVLLHIMELLGGYIWRTDIPAIIKEMVFHLFAQTLRVLSISESGLLNMLLTASPRLSPSLALLLQLQVELKKLYDDEIKHWPSDTTITGTGVGLGVSDHGRFSTYFHALLELCLAISEVNTPAPAPPPRATMSSESTGGAEPTSPASISSPDLRSASAPPGSSLDDSPPLSEKTSTTSLPPTSASPMSAGKRKKLKAKRERDRGSMTPTKRGGAGGGSPPPLDAAEDEPGTSSRPSGSGGAGVSAIASKPAEEILWFHRALTLSQILRFLIRGDAKGERMTSAAIVDAAGALHEITAYSRLLVVSGIPACLPADAVRSALTKAANACGGGLYKDEVYLPVQEIELMDMSPDEDKSAVTAMECSIENMTNQPSPAQTPDSDDGTTLSQPKSTEPKKIQQLKGYAVIELRSRTKVETARQALLKSQVLLDGLSVHPDDVPEESLSITPVSPSLLADVQGNTALESYLMDKLIASSNQELSDGLVIALTEIFHSCFISEQRVSVDPRQESGYICLGREQITLNTAGNLMYSFFNAVKASKKSFHDQIRDVLRRYGVPKVMDKDDSDKKGKLSKKSSKPSKEKLVFGTVSKSTSREKKLKPKDSSDKMNKDITDVESVTKSKSKQDVKEDDKLLTLAGFMSFVGDKVKQDVRTVWQGLMACGYDLHFERFTCIDITQAHQMSSLWSLEMDCAIVDYVNSLCQHLAISPARLHPHEVYFTQAQLASAQYSCLQGMAVESVRLRFALLQAVNNSLQSFFLPLVDTRPALTPAYTQSMAAVLANDGGRGLMFYDTKTMFVNRVLNATAQRKPDQAAPEITLDPLEVVGADRPSAADSEFCQALRQLASVPSSQLCVKLAAGGDPTYAFNVRFTGEEVHGTSGSFRHFLWQVARELESSELGLFLPVSHSYKHHGKFILAPGSMTFAEEKMLQFLGQLLAITIRADIPIGLNLLPVFWKNLVGINLDPVSDLQEVDSGTYNYIKKFELVESEDELLSLCADQMPAFVYNSLTGEEVELFPGGKRDFVNWEKRHHYVECVRALRLSELRCVERTAAVRAGMASLLPIHTLALMSPADIQMRVCGKPDVNLEFLKAHTMYQVGLMETDVHIQYFWNVLEGFSQDDLSKFIKFACNQERIPQCCPCKDGGVDTAHVPPYPMKIAPPDGPGTPDARYIRVETCMFMIKLPQYSSEQLMRERLLYAIHCREDPLSG